MKTANRKGIVQAVMGVTALGAMLVAGSTKAQAQVAVGVQYGYPSNAPYYDGRQVYNRDDRGRRDWDRDDDGYRDERREAYGRQQQYLRQQEYIRQQEYARREAYARQQAWQRHEAHERQEEWEEHGGRNYGWDR
ncbi:MAG: hypothetical protein NVSMB62_00490 [Acidobacteriaceae bacterium]